MGFMGLLIHTYLNTRSCRHFFIFWLWRRKGHCFRYHVHIYACGVLIILWFPFSLSAQQQVVIFENAHHHISIINSSSIIAIITAPLLYYYFMLDNHNALLHVLPDTFLRVLTLHSLLTWLSSFLNDNIFSSSIFAVHWKLVRMSSKNVTKKTRSVSEWERETR